MSALREQLPLKTAIAVFYIFLGVQVVYGEEKKLQCVSTVVPDQPTNLNVEVGDSKAILTWSPPSNSGCVDFYNVTYMAIGPLGDKGKQSQMQTQTTNSTFTGLENAVRYAFFVESVNSKLQNRTNPAVITAIPQRICSSDQPVSPPANVTAYSIGNSVRLCWKQSPLGGCPDEYRVAHRMVPLTDDEVRAAAWKFQTVKNAGCMTINSLIDRRTYQFAVQSYSTGQNKGSFAGAQATITKDWKILPVENYYPICSGAVSGKCNPMTCAQQAAAMKCNSAVLRQVDTGSKTVVQYCADTCGSSIDISTGISRTPAAEPNIMKMDEEDIENGCCSNT